MNQPDSTCLKCGGPMELGYTPDYAHGAVYLGRWIRGRPKSRFFSIFDRLLIGRPGTLAVPIGVQRCQSCGFLEFYAREEFIPK
jgi:hypothetical protein